MATLCIQHSDPYETDTLACPFTSDEDVSEFRRGANHAVSEYIACEEVSGEMVAARMMMCRVPPLEYPYWFGVYTSYRHLIAKRKARAALDS